MSWLHRDHHEHERETEQLSEIARELRSILLELRHITRLLTQPKPVNVNAVTNVTDPSGDIDMAQTTYMSQQGKSVLTFTTADVNGVDITSRCSYAVTSDGAAMALDAVAGNTVPIVKTPGTANLTIKTTDSSGDTVPDVVLACTIIAPPPLTAQTTVSDSDPTATIT